MKNVIFTSAFPTRLVMTGNYSKVGVLEVMSVVLYTKRPHEPISLSTVNPPQNLLNHHRFNMELEPALWSGAKFFTSIREPLSMFRSSYNFHYYRFSSNSKVLHRKCNNACWSEPFRKRCCRAFCLSF